MGVQYFGQFLLDRQVISRRQLLEAAALQKSTHQKIGVLAIDRGYLTAQQVNRILNLQRSRNKPFGQIGIDEGMLTREQVEELLTLQKADRVLLGEALVEKGALTLETLETHLKEYRKDQIHAEETIHGSFEKLPEQLLGSVNHATNILQTMMNRMLEEPCKVSDVAEVPFRSIPRGDHLVTQEITGENPMVLTLGLTQSLLLQFAARMLRREFQEVDELAMDSMKELINLVAGHLCVALSNQGIQSDTLPPVCQPPGKFTCPYPECHAIRIRLLSPSETFDFTLYLA